MQKPNGLPVKRALDYDVNTEYNSALYRLVGDASLVFF